MTEKEWQRRITDTCDYLGLMWHHETDSRRSKGGFPDLVISGPGGTIFAELKAARGKITPAQWAWIDAINGSGAECWVWRPHHWPEVLDRLQRLAKP